MLSVLIEKALQASPSSLITEFFVWVIVIIFLVSIFWKKKGKHIEFTAYTSTLLTSVGILGTFTGIIIGLLSFDTFNINESIGPLLDGLKTAFVTSLVGMFLSIFYRSLTTSSYFKSLHKPQATFESLYEITRSQANDIASIRTYLEKMPEVEMRVVERLSKFSEEQSEKAFKLVIKSLNNIVKDFNTHLIEQFGDNFTRLHVATLKMVEWQSENKEQLLEIKKQYENNLQSTEKSTQLLSDFSKNVIQINDVMGILQKVIKTNENQIDNLSTHLKVFENIKNNAVDALPILDKQVKETLKASEIANSVVLENSKLMQVALSSVIQDQEKEFSLQIEKLITRIEGSFNEGLISTDKNIQKQIELMDRIMGDEIESVMRSMGEALTTISDQFTQDYSKLVNQMSLITQQKVIEV